MKIVLIAAVAIILSSCGHEEMQALVADDQMIEYKLQDGQYGVIVLSGEGLSMENMRKAAHQKAAAVTAGQGYRRFVIESESEIQVAKGNLQSTTALRVVFRCY